MDAVEEIKSRLNIEDVIGEYVQLKRAGRNWKGLSPFSAEKSPSFVVSPEKQIWHDFSSGKGGNMFSFVMEMEGLDFREALQLLARKAGVDLEQFRPKGGAGAGGSGGAGATRGREKERLYAALELATKFYQAHFARNKIALEYALKKRAFSKATALEWRLGYSPNSGSALVTFLKSKGFSDDELKLAGLTAQRYRGVGDMFRGRLMIPLCDPQGRVIGFTARLLADDPSAPKYINTPQTPLYDKSRHVFGLHFAKESIRKTKYAVIAEGNLDVITSHQAGVWQVVATAGTALTEFQLKALGRFTPDIRLSFDADKAGLNATERAIPIASRVKVSLSIITIPSGKDPDELIRQDPKMWEQVIAEPQYALDWLMARYATLLDLKSAQGKREFSDVILQVVRGLQDQVEQEHYLAEVGKLIGVSRDALMSKLKGQVAAEPSARALRRPKNPPQTTAKTDGEYAKTQNNLLALLLLQPKLRDASAMQILVPQMFRGENQQAMLAFLQANPDFAGELATAEALRPLADYVKILSLLYEELYQGLEITELQYEAARLQAHLIDQYVKTQKQQIAYELATADDVQMKTLLETAAQLDTLLKTHKGGA